MQNQLHYVIIANPENRRVKMFQEALKNLSMPPAKIISYQDLINHQANLSIVDQANTIIRIESPGENFTVECALIKMGAEILFNNEIDNGDQLIDNKLIDNFITDHLVKISPDMIDDYLADDAGRIYYPHLWYLGFTKLLNNLTKELAQYQGWRWMNAPEDILLMFNKLKCQQLLAKNGIPVPHRLGIVKSFEHLHEMMRAQNINRVFLKLAHGSSASGVVAYRINKDNQCAITSVELVKHQYMIKLYNSLKLRTYYDIAEIRSIVDELARYNLFAEEWLPKAGFQGRTCDLRVLMIKDQPSHMIVRLSKHPITNLHLLNARGDAEKLREYIGAKKWQPMLNSCQRVMQCFAQSHYAGLDIMFSPTFNKHYILEVNAFGDLLPNLLRDNLDTYSAEIMAI